MIYRDRTFCAAACLNSECPKNWEYEVERYYALPKPRPEVAIAILSDGCPDYQPAREALAE